jgi:O-antigen ligase
MKVTETSLLTLPLKTNTMAQLHNTFRQNEQNRLGLCFFGVLVWIFLEYGRPANPLMLPLVISAILFFNWLGLPAKKWNPQIVCFLLLLGEMLLTVPLANNTYSVVWTTYNMTVLLILICIPLIHFVDSLRKVTILINTYLLVFLYIGIIAMVNGGMGPARNSGGQDENYTAALMCMAMPIAYFSIYTVKGGLKKLLRLGAIGVYAVAVVVGVSRGGFVGMVVVFLYCLLKSPRKLTGMFIGGVAIILVLTVASNDYWKEIDTISDPHEGTADLRIEAWKIAFRMFQHNPILGIGPDNFRWNASSYQSEEQLEKYGRQLFLYTHSMYFETLSELGLVGVSLLCAVLYFNYKDIKFMTKQLQQLKEALGKKPGGTTEAYRTFSGDCTRIRCYAYGLMGATLGLLAAFAFLSGFYYSNFWVLTAMIVALKEVSIARLERYRELEGGSAK